MLKVTIELWPMGSEARKKEIFNCFIANVGMGKNGYDYVYYGESDRDPPIQGKVYDHGRADGLNVLMRKFYEIAAMRENVVHSFTDYDKKVIDAMKRILSKET